MAQNNPLLVQSQIRQNASEVSSFLQDISSWSTEMKAKEIANSSAEIKPTSKVPLRNDPSQMKKDAKECQNLDSKKTSNKLCDYEKWDKFDADEICKELDAVDKKEELSEEEKVLQRALEIRKQEAANQKKEEGNKYLAQKEYQKAIDCYSQGIQAYSSNAILYANRAQAYLHLKEYNSTVEDCNKALKLNPSYVKALFRRGKAYHALNNFTMAKADLTQVLKHDKNNSEARTLLGDLNKRTMFNSGGKNSLLTHVKTVYKNNESELVAEKFPKIIRAINKPINKRSKRPLIPIHIRIREPKKRKTVDSPMTPDKIGFPVSPSLPNLFSKLDVTPETSQTQANVTQIPHKPATSVQFFKNWKSFMKSEDHSAAALYLKQLTEDDYQIFQESMEGSTMSQIIELLVWEFIPQKWDFLPHFKGLTTVRRFKTLLFFLNEKDRANIRKLLHECPSDVKKNLEVLYEC